MLRVQASRVLKHASAPRPRTLQSVRFFKPCKSGREFDLAVIGGGPAGFAGAVRGYDYGKHVALIDAPAKEGRIPGLGSVT